MVNSDPIKLGFIGAGFISQLAHLPSFYSDPRVKIIAISDFLTPKMSDIFKKNLIHAIAQSFREAR